MHPDARSLVERLGLVAHPEGGFYRETFRSSLSVQARKGERAASTAIYFLLPAGTFSAWHRVASDEVWHFYEGDPVEIVTIDARGELAVTRLGNNLGNGHQPQLVVAAGVLQAARTTGDRFSLCGCTVAPGFEFGDFEMPPRRELVGLYPAHRREIEALTREEG